MTMLDLSLQSEYLHLWPLPCSTEVLDNIDNPALLAIFPVQMPASIHSSLPSYLVHVALLRPLRRRDINTSDPPTRQRFTKHRNISSQRVEIDDADNAVPVRTLFEVRLLTSS